MAVGPDNCVLHLLFDWTERSHLCDAVLALLLLNDEIDERIN
jgi:hypothetical protein